MGGAQPRVITHSRRAVTAQRASRTRTWPRRKWPHRFPHTPGGISSEVTRSMRRFFLLPVDMGFLLETHEQEARSRSKEFNGTPCSVLPAPCY